MRCRFDAECAPTPPGRTLVFSLALLLVGGLGCTKNYYMSVGSSSPRPQLDFPRLRERNVESLRAESGGVSVAVHFAPGEESLARVALAEAIAAVEHATSALGVDADDSMSLDLHPWPEGEASPGFSATGQGYRSVIFYSDAGDLLSDSNMSARAALRPAIVHQVAIRHLLKGRTLDPARDRWIVEGLAEALADEYTAALDPELWRLVRRWNPPPAVLEVSELTTWNDRELFAMIDAFRRGDQRLAAYYGQRETLRLAAARGLLLEWLSAARARGTEQPARALLERIEAADEPFDWEATRRLAEEMTGEPVEELARLTGEERTALRRRSWEARSSPDLVERVGALRVLTYLGLPADAAPGELRDAFSTADTLDPADRSTLKEAAAGAVAHSGDPELARWALDSLLLDGDRAFNYLSIPRLWQLVGQSDRAAALSALVAILDDDRFSLAVQESADRSLQALTGAEAGWSATAAVRERRLAVDRWRRLIASEGLN